MQSRFFDKCFSPLYKKTHPMLAAAVYCTSVVVSALILTKFYPPRHDPGTPVLVVAVLITALVQFALYTVLVGAFHILARFRGVRSQLTVVASGVVLAHVPSVALQSMILLIPGFARVVPTSRFLIPLTSPAAWLPEVSLHSTLVGLLNTFDPLNLAKVVLLSVVLQEAARLSFAQAVIVNLIMGFALVILL